MQKLLKRVALAKNQAKRRAAREKGKELNVEKRVQLSEQQNLHASKRKDIHAARLARREDWVLGPLAPRRDVGDNKNTYGALDTARLRGVEKSDGFWKDWCIVEGDRVVIVENGHRDRGKIGRVTSVREKAEECIVHGLNQVDIAVPEYMLLKEQDKNPLRVFEAPIPFRSVRLVAPLPHPETGVLRDVVIKELRKSKHAQKLAKDRRPHRYIAGLDPPTRIPYPETKEEDHEDYEVDTLRMSVEDTTFIPTLIRPPMPPSIIDELRNKYSKYRDRHDPEYLQRKMLEDEQAQARKDSVRKMMTPIQELNAKTNAEKKARGTPELSEEMLEKIGEFMARKQASESTSQLTVD